MCDNYVQQSKELLEGITIKLNEFSNTRGKEAKCALVPGLMTDVFNVIGLLDVSSDSIKFVENILREMNKLENEAEYEEMFYRYVGKLESVLTIWRERASASESLDSISESDCESESEIQCYECLDDRMKGGYMDCCGVPLCWSCVNSENAILEYDEEDDSIKCPRCDRWGHLDELIG